MNKNRMIASTLTVALAFVGVARGQTTLEFNVPGPAPWAVATNWAPVFTPGDGFPADIVGISNGGTVTLAAAAPFPVNGVFIGEAGHPVALPVGVGTMIMSGGSLDVVAQASDDGTIPAVGAFRVGVGGTGTFQMTGGALNISNDFSSGGAVASSVAISGSSSLSVGSANLQRTTRIRGPNVSFESAGAVSIGGTFIPEITAPTHSLIDAFGASAAIGGTLAPEFNGVVPAVGNSWTLVQAGTISGNFANAGNVQVAGITPVAGAKFISVNTGTELQLQYTNALTLSVNRRTGQAQIVNHIGSISFDGYSVGDSLGNLNPATWSSLDDQGTTGDSWKEANPTNVRLSELNPTGNGTLGAGASHALGNILIPDTEFGEAVPNLTFDYHLPGGRTVAGIVEMTGPRNNLILYVDPATGQAAFQNESLFPASLDGYSIASASGSLRPAQWNSLDDQNVEGGTFFEANPSANRVSELNPTESLLLAPNSGALLLGNLFNPAGTRDLAFSFHLTGGGGGPLGDTDGSGDVDLDDLNNVRNNFGGNGLGDTDGDTDVDLDDLNNVRNNFGAVGGGGGPTGTFNGVVVYGAIPAGLGNPVPEPSSIALLAVAALVVLGVKRRR